MALPESEPTALMTFRASLPAAARELCWLPAYHFTLAFLPAGQGYTAFQMHFCPTTRQYAWNVAHYQDLTQEERHA